MSEYKAGKSSNQALLGSYFRSDFCENDWTVTFLLIVRKHAVTGFRMGGYRSSHSQLQRVFITMRSEFTDPSFFKYCFEITAHGIWNSLRMMLNLTFGKCSGGWYSWTRASS